MCSILTSGRAAEGVNDFRPVLAAAALLALWRYDFVAKKQFGGITGDLAGWFLQRAELWMLAALAVSQWGGVL